MGSYLSQSRYRWAGSAHCADARRSGEAAGQPLGQDGAGIYRAEPAGPDFNLPGRYRATRWAADRMVTDLDRSQRVLLCRSGPHRQQPDREAVSLSVVGRGR